MASEILAEWLARIEYKQDLILGELKKGQFSHFTSLTAPRTCPACNQSVQHQLHAMKKIVIRLCGCRTGIVPPPDFEALAPPPAAGGKNRGELSDENGPDTGSFRGRSSRGRQSDG